ncbi:MAG: leucine-rich repeat domain-containing protein [Promethearchaeota archaeon]
MSRKLTNYQDVELIAEEAAVLIDLEQQLGQLIPHVEELDDLEDCTSVGFASEEHHVIGLALDMQELTQVPESIWQLSHLRLLSLNGNQLQTVPEDIRQLRNLQYLDLEWNSLQTLPDTIGHLHNLQTLKLEGNELQSLPDTIGQLRNLYCLILSGNQLRALPDTIERLHDLHYLELRGNPLNLVNLVLILHLIQKKPEITLFYPPSLFNHPLVQPLNGMSLKCLRQSCPFCGASEVVTGQTMKTQQDQLICAQCESRIT